MTQEPCIACGAERWAALYGELVRCDACGFVRAADLPSAEVLATLYGAAYFEGEEYADYLGDRDVHRFNFRRRLGRIKSLAGQIESLYEIGCAYGLWLELAAENGIPAAGIDISANAVRHAREVPKQEASVGAFRTCARRPRSSSLCMWTRSSISRTRGDGRRSRACCQRAAALRHHGRHRPGDARRQGPVADDPPADPSQYFAHERHRFLGATARTQHIESEPMCRSPTARWPVCGGSARGSTRRSPARHGGAAALTRRVRFTLDLATSCWSAPAGLASPRPRWTYLPMWASAYRNGSLGILINPV